MRQTRFKNETIKKCAECNGTGTVIENGEQKRCPVCDGSGMVRRVAEGTVTYTPYEN